MGTPEQRLAGSLGEPLPKEDLDPRHFYAAYVFDKAVLSWRDVAVLIDQAHQFECPVRYWWASEVSNLTGAFDRLIVCIHHPSLAKAVEMHGILRQAAAKRQVAWDDFEAAALDAYRAHGKAIDDPKDISGPDGTPLFPSERAGHADVLYTLTREDVQLVAQGMLGRRLSDAEMAAVGEELPGVINWMDPIEFTIWTCQQAGNVGAAAAGERVRPVDKEALFAEIANVESMLVHAAFTEQDEYESTVRRLKETYQALVTELSSTEKSETIERLLARIEDQDQDLSPVMTQKAMDDYGFRPDELGELFASGQVVENEEGANAFIFHLVDAWLNCLK